MSELKNKMMTRSRQSKPTVDIATPEKPQDNPKSKPKNVAQKRPMQNKSLFSMGFKKQQTKIAPQPVEILYSVKQLLKSTSLNTILEHCPKVKSLYQLLCSQPLVNQKLVFSCLDKYFHGNTTSLWANKYAPRSLSELFQPDFTEKIQQWIKDFYYFRKDTQDQNDLSFIDDDFEEQSYSKSLQVRMKQYGWNCKALLLKGRSGVGKTSLLNAIAKSMNIRCFEYASDVDQLQKMKQLVDGSQSQCVNNYQINKKQQQNNKLMRQNSSITKFLPSNSKKKEELQTKQPKRLQLFRNFSHYFPPFDKADKQGAEDSYFRCLFDSINKAQIPYVLTTDKLQFSFRDKSSSQKFSKFDQIEFIENTVEDLTYLYWAIYQIQHNLSFDYSRKIKKEGLFNQLNDQSKQDKYEIVQNLHLIRQLVIASNKKPLYIAKYLQFVVHQAQKILQDTQDPQASHTKFMQKAIQNVGNEIIRRTNSSDLINNIQWALYRKRIQYQVNPLEQTAAEDIQKSQKSVEKQEECVTEKKPTIREIRKKLDLTVLQDHKVFHNQYFNLDDQPEQSLNYMTNISTKYHIGAKKTILQNIKSRMNGAGEQKQKKRPYMSLKEQQMFYLPLFFPAKRSSRSLRKQNKESLEENLSKIMNPREMAYMEKFGKFLFTY